MIWIAKRWRFPKVIWGFFIAEFILTVPALVLFGLADPDNYRTALWKDGHENCFNSSPEQILYAMYNYKYLPTPLVWSPFITTFNVVISVLSMFILLVKAIGFILHIWLPIISFFVHGGVAAVWAYSVYAQTSSDMNDPKCPQPGAPWYITKSCSVAVHEANLDGCRQAKAALAISILMLIIFTGNTVFAAISSIPSASEKEDRMREKEEDEDSDVDEMEAGNGKTNSDDNSIELEEISYLPGVKGPFKGLPSLPQHQDPNTPRSTAFNRLGGRRGELPLRQ